MKDLSANSNDLAYELTRTAEWRAEKEQRHHNDERNQTARVLLHKLSTQKASEELTARYNELSNEVEPDRWSEAHSNVLGDIGFSFQPEHVDEVFGRVIEKLSR